MTLQIVCGTSKDEQHPSVSLSASFSLSLSPHPHILFLWDWVSLLCSYGCPGTYHINWAILKLREIHLPGYWVLKLKAWAIMPGLFVFLCSVCQLCYGLGRHISAFAWLSFWWMCSFCRKPFQVSNIVYEVGFFLLIWKIFKYFFDKGSLSGSHVTGLFLDGHICPEIIHGSLWKSGWLHFKVTQFLSFCPLCQRCLGCCSPKGVEDNFPLCIQDVLSFTFELRLPGKNFWGLCEQAVMYHFFLCADPAHSAPFISFCFFLLTILSFSTVLLKW